MQSTIQPWKLNKQEKIHSEMVHKSNARSHTHPKNKTKEEKKVHISIWISKCHINYRDLLSQTKFQPISVYQEKERSLERERTKSRMQQKNKEVYLKPSKGFSFLFFRDSSSDSADALVERLNLKKQQLELLCSLPRE